MSNELDSYRDPQDANIALFLMENDGDMLTDILVAALNDAFRILGDELKGDSIH